MQDCDFYLQQLCPIGKSHAAVDTCLSCANSFDFILSKTNCTEDSINTFCTTGRDCEDIMAAVKCTAAGDKTGCLSCAMEHYTDIFSHHGCTWELMQVVCEQKPADPVSCDSSLEKLCPDLKDQAQWCEGCVAGNVYELTEAGCTYETVYEFCYGEKPNYGCEDQLYNSCGDVFEQGATCFRCLNSNQDVLRQAGCQNELLSEFCQEPHPPEPPVDGKCMAAMKEYCPLTDRETPDQCIGCMKENYAALIGGPHCDKGYMIDYCDRFEPIPPGLRGAKRFTRAELEAMLPSLDQAKLAKAKAHWKRYKETKHDGFFGKKDH